MFFERKLNCCGIWELWGFDSTAKHLVAKQTKTTLEGAHCTERAGYKGCEGAAFILATLTPGSSKEAEAVLDALGFEKVNAHVNPRSGAKLRLYLANGDAVYKKLDKLDKLAKEAAVSVHSNSYSNGCKACAGMGYGRWYYADTGRHARK